MIGLTKRSRDKSVFRTKGAEEPPDCPRGNDNHPHTSTENADKTKRSHDESSDVLESENSLNDSTVEDKSVSKSLPSQNDNKIITTSVVSSENASAPVLVKETSMQKGKNVLDGTLKTEEAESDSEVLPSSSSDSADSIADEDDMSQSSSESILPLHSFSFSEHEEDDIQALNDELKGIQRLERKLELRRQRLRRLSAGRRSSYVKMLEANAAAADAVTLAAYKKRCGADNVEQHADSKNDSTKAAQSTNKGEGTANDNTPESNATTKQSTSMSLWWAILFEMNHTLPSIAIVLVVLMGHISFYSGLEVVLKTVFYTFLDRFLTLNQFMTIQVILGLLFIRVNGSLFYWLDQNNFHLVRMEMQNRSKLGTRDAQFMKRIQGTVLSSALNMFGYYLASVGLFHFYYNGLLKVLQPLEEWYMEAFQAVGGTYSATGQQEISPCNELTELVASHGKFAQRLVDYFCHDETQEWRLIGLLYHGCWLAVTAILGVYVGQNVLEYCD